MKIQHFVGPCACAEQRTCQVIEATLEATSLCSVVAGYSCPIERVRASSIQLWTRRSFDNNVLAGSPLE